VVTLPKVTPQLVTRVGVSALRILRTPSRRFCGSLD